MRVPTASPVQVAQQLDQLTGTIDELRRTGNAILDLLPTDAPLFACADLTTGICHLKRAAVALDRAADQLAAAEIQTEHQAADDAWADRAWQVDSTTRQCCGSIGGHAPDCKADGTLRDHQLGGIQRGIRTLLVQVPARSWTVDEAQAVWEALAGILHRRTVTGNVRRHR